MTEFQHDPYREDRPDNPVEPLLRMDRMPSIWCPGCGIGTTVNCFARAIEKTGWDLDGMAIVSGIGCTGRVAGYGKVDSFHTTHGRAIPFATGLKLANPKLNVVVYSGDGDLSAIGGNHLIHAARRNIGLKVLLVNNTIYGMTGGQVAPTTPTGIRTATTPYGNQEAPMRITEMVTAAGATFSARWTTFHVFQLIKAMKKALSHEGFAFVEIMSQCPTSYGKFTRERMAPTTLRRFKESAVRVKKAQGMSEEDLEDKLVIGTFTDKQRPEFARSLDELARARMAEES